MLFMEVPSVTIASGHKERLERSPLNVTVITAKEIKERGYRHIRDVLLTVPGYDIDYDRDEWVFSARGITKDDNKRYLLLIDGHRNYMIGGGWGTGELQELPNDLSNVKQIEIVRGPGAIYWGDDALAGLINIVTEDAADLAKPNSVSVTEGTQDTQKGNFKFSTREGNSGMVLSGSYVKSEGSIIEADASAKYAFLDSTTTFTLPPYGRYTTALDKYFPSYRLQLKGYNGDFNYNAYYFFSDVWNRQYEINHGRDARMPRHDIWLDGSWEKTVLQDLNIKTGLSASTLRESYVVVRGNTMPAGGTVPTNIDRWQRNVKANLDFLKPFIDNKLVLSLGFLEQVTVFDDSRIISANPPAYAGPGIKGTGDSSNGTMYTENEVGAYLSATYKPITELAITAAGRWDYNFDRVKGTSGNPNTFSPRFAAIWDATNSSIIKLLYNTGFLKFSGADERQLAPEKIQEYELVLIQKVDRFSITPTLYYQKLFDMSFLPPTGGTAQGGTLVPRINGGSEVSYGLELEAKGDIGEHSVWLNGSYGRASTADLPDSVPYDDRRITSGGQKINYSQAMVRGGATLRLPYNVFVAPTVRVQSSKVIRLTPAVTSLDDATYGSTGNLYYLDLNIGWDIMEALSLNLYANNLTDNRTLLPMAIRNGTYQPYGRYLEAKVTLSW